MLSQNKTIQKIKFMNLMVLCLISVLMVGLLIPHTNYLNAKSNYHVNDTLVIKDKIFDNNSLIYGKPYEQWTSEWWQWAYSIPLEIHPAYDDTGIFCNINQKKSCLVFPRYFQPFYHTRVFNSK